MLILVLDSCGSSCGVGVYDGAKTLACAQESMQRGQDARLMPMVVEALKQAERDFSDFDRIAVTRGPGSFTGVRVCLAAARGIGLASGKPVIGIDRFAIYRLLHGRFEKTPLKQHRHPRPVSEHGAGCGGDPIYFGAEKNLLVVIDSKRAELFCKFYPSQGAPYDAGMMKEEEIQAFLAAHPDTEVAGDLATPDDDILAACAQLAAQADPKNPEVLPRPLYLRAPDVTFASVKS